VQLVPTMYYSGHVGHFFGDRARHPAEALQSSAALHMMGQIDEERKPFADSLVSDEEMVGVLDSFQTSRGANGFGSTDKKRPLEL
jgi:hypothetical protein